MTTSSSRKAGLCGFSVGLLGLLLSASVAPAQQSMQVQPWAAALLAQSPRHQESVTIDNHGKALHGWVVYPAGVAKAPVVLVLHEVFGLTDSTRHTADQIAAMGYIAIAPDMLSGLGPNGGGSGTFTEEQHQGSDVLTSRTDASVNSDIEAWADYGLQKAQANGKFAIVGLSWGGGAAFRYAALTKRSDLRAVFVFYDVGPPAENQKYEGAPATIPVAGIQVPVYGFYGSTDTRATSSVEASKAAMAAAGKRYQPIIYDGADHAYMRMGEMPDANNKANPAAVKASLDRLRDLLQGL